MVDIEQACIVMHDAYEKAAVGAGWETNPESRKPWADVPESNKVTMRAAVEALVNWLADDQADDQLPQSWGCNNPDCETCI